MVYNYDYRKARAVYKNAKMVFTMKHHPIVFGYGEGIPVISIALDDYYWHKNSGAMKNCGQADFCLTEQEFYSDDAVQRIDLFFKNYDSLKAAVIAWNEEMKPLDCEVQQRVLAEIL